MKKENWIHPKMWKEKRKMNWKSRKYISYLFKFPFPLVSLVDVASLSIYLSIDISIYLYFKPLTCLSIYPLIQYYKIRLSWFSETIKYIYWYLLLILNQIWQLSSFVNFSERYHRLRRISFDRSQKRCLSLPIAS